MSVKPCEPLGVPRREQGRVSWVLAMCFFPSRELVIQVMFPLKKFIVAYYTLMKVKKFFEFGVFTISFEIIQNSLSHCAFNSMYFTE